MNDDLLRLAEELAGTVSPDDAPCEQNNSGAAAWMMGYVAGVRALAAAQGTPAAGVLSHGCELCQQMAARWCEQCARKFIAADTTAIDCPLCGETVKQVASATLSLALWQHVNWTCEKARARVDLKSMANQVRGGHPHD